MTVSFKEFISIQKTGKKAEGRIGGCLRGGVIENGYFYAIGASGYIFSDKTENVKELKLY